MRRVVVVLWLAAGLASTGESRARAQAADGLAPLARALDDSPSSETYDAYAQAAFREKRWDEAIAHLKVGVAKLPGYHQGWYKLGYAYRQVRAFSDAAVAYRKFAELEPTQSDPYFGLAAALQGVGDKSGAADAYRRYIELEKAPAKRKFVEQAQAELVKLQPSVTPPPPVIVTPPPVIVTPPPVVVTQPPVVAPPVIAPPTSSALSLRAEADKLRRAGKLPEAASAFERALAADPGNLDLHVELGDVYFAQKRYGDAVRIFHAATERDPGYALGWYNLAHADAQAGDPASAVRAYRAYIKLRPSDPDPYYGLGHACKAAGDKQGAVEAFRTYLQMEHRPELQRWIDRARQELRDLGSSASRGNTRDLKNPFERVPTHDLKNPFDDHPGYASADDFLPVDDMPSDAAQREHVRIARELAADDILPIDLDEDVVKLPEGPAADQRERLSRYASALASYRAVLEREANEAAVLYQRGADRLVAADLRGAQRVWAQSAARDKTIEEARQKLEKARQGLTK